MAINFLIIIPCYNEEKRLPQKAFISFLSQKSAKNIHFLFVNDGSKDNTIRLLNSLAKNHEQFKVLDLKKNVGKAEAIRLGMLQSSNKSYDYLGFLDADLATPLEELENLIYHTKKSPAPYLIIGSRVKLLGSTNIKRKPRRHYIGRIFATIVSNMLNLPIYDTQCGAKLVKKEIVPRIFEQPFLSKWLFDVEILFRLKSNFRDFETRIVEVPLKKWEDIDGSKISSSYYFKAPWDLLRIYFHYK